MASLLIALLLFSIGVQVVHAQNEYNPMTQTYEAYIYNDTNCTNPIYYQKSLLTERDTECFYVSAVFNYLQLGFSYSLIDGFSYIINLNCSSDCDNCQIVNIPYDTCYGLNQYSIFVSEVRDSATNILLEILIPLGVILCCCCGLAAYIGNKRRDTAPAGYETI